MKNRLNFSPRPFSSGQMGMLPFWLLNLLMVVVLGGSVLYWYRLRHENVAAHRQIGELKGRQRELAERNRQLVGELRDIDIKAYRKTIRQFSEVQAASQTQWGRLLDDLGGLLPEDVRLVSIRPASRKTRRGGSLLKLSAEARTKQKQLVFIRNLQGHASFRNIHFETEHYDRAGVAVAFEVLLIYEPRRG